MNPKMEEVVHRSYSSKPKYQEVMPGVPEDYKQVTTLGDLLKINYKHSSVESQLRGNLVAKLKKGENPVHLGLQLVALDDFLALRRY